MLFNLDWLQEGRKFPPAEEVARIQKYNDNLLLFDGDIAPGFVCKEEYLKARMRIERVINNYADIISFPVDLNYHRLISVKTADFVCGEKPIISSKGAKDEKLTEMLKETNFYSKLYTCAIDISRYGDGLLRIYKKHDGKNGLVVIDPRRWFKIVNEEDPTEILNHVLAWVSERKIDDKRKEYRLHVQIHYKGYYIKRTYEAPVCSFIDYTIPQTGQHIKQFKTFTIGKQIGGDEVVRTGLTDFAIIPLTGLITSDDCYGKDDYEPIDSVLAEIWARLGQISIILDKHSAPDVYAPESAFTRNEKGEWVLRTGGNCYVVGKDEPPPGYMVWDGQLEANFRKVELLLKQLYRVSEMGAVFEASESASNIAVETMKARFISAIKKAERITNNIDESVKKAIALLSEIGWVKITPKEINIEWCDGLPQDEATEIQNATAKINAGLSTARRENIERFGLSEELANEVQSEVEEQRAAAAVYMGLGGGFGGVEEDKVDDEA